MASRLSRATLHAVAAGYLARIGPFAQWLPLLLFSLIVGMQLNQEWPFPQDDLLRNVVAYAWHFDYGKLYPFAPGLPKFDPYWLFDRVLGAVTQATSPEQAVRLAQGMGALAFLGASLGAVRGLSHPVPRISLVLFLVLGTLVTSRLVAGRPEVWATAWLLSAASLTPGRWLVLGLVISPCYWLTPVYAVGALLLQTTWRVRLGCMAMAVGLTALFWLSLAQGEWVSQVLALPHLAAQRTVVALEGERPWLLLHYPGTWLLLGGLALTVFWHGRRGREAQWLVVAGYFCMIGNMRHILVIAPAIALWIARQNWEFNRPGTREGHCLVAVVAGMLCMAQMPGRASLPLMTVPKGSVVLSGYSAALFALPLANPGTVQIAPSIESAMDSREITRLAAAVSAGSLTCAQVRPYPFTHVIAPVRVALQGDCFVKSQQLNKWQLWELRP